MSLTEVLSAQQGASLAVSFLVSPLLATAERDAGVRGSVREAMSGLGMEVVGKGVPTGEGSEGGSGERPVGRTGGAVT